MEKSDLKTGDHHAIFWKDQKYYKSWTKETVFVYILDFTFHGVSRAKTDLPNKYIFNFVFG